MRLKYVKSQTSAAPDSSEEAPPFLKNMSVVTFGGNSVLSVVAQKKIRDKLLSIGYIEGKQFYIYNGRLYMSRGFDLSSINHLIALEIAGSRYKEEDVKKVNLVEANNAENYPGKINSIVWETIDIRGGISRISGLLQDIYNTMIELGFGDRDFTVRGGMVFVNADSDKKASDKRGIEFSGRSPKDCVVRILRSKGLVKQRSDLLIKTFPSGNMVYDSMWVNYKYPVENYSDEDEIERYATGINEWFKNLEFVVDSDYQKYSKGLRLNAYSPNYNKMLSAISDFEREMGYHSSFVRQYETKASPKKIWVDANLSFDNPNDSGFEELLDDLRRSAFSEGDDFSVSGTRLMINALSINYHSIQVFLFRMARDSKHGLKGYEIKFGPVNKDWIDIHQYWGPIVPDRFKTDDYTDSETEYLFRSSEKGGTFILSTDEAQYIGKLYANKCVAELLQKGISDFYATYNGQVYCLKSQADEFLLVCGEFDSQMGSKISLLKNASDRDEFMKDLLSERDYIKFKAERNRESAEYVRKMMTNSEYPTSFLGHISDDNILRIAAETNRLKGAGFLGASDGVKVDEVRRAIEDLKLYPGYSNLAAGMGKTAHSYSDSFEALARRRGINLGPDYKSNGDIRGVYEYVAAANEFNFLKVNAFFFEFVYNNKFKEGKEGLSQEDLYNRLLVAVLSIAYSILNGLRSHQMFTTTASDIKEKREKKAKFNLFLNAFDSPGLYELALNVSKRVFFGKETEYYNLPTVASVKSSPFYKSILKDLNAYFSGTMSGMND